MLNGGVGPSNKDGSAGGVGFLHHSFDGQRGGDSDPGHLSDVEDQNPVVLHKPHPGTDAFRRTETERPPQSEQHQFPATAADQTLLLIREQCVDRIGWIARIVFFHSLQL